MKSFFSFFLSLVSLIGYSEKEYAYSISNIPAELMVDANTVVRSETVNISIKEIDEMEYSFHRAVSVLNARGLASLDLSWRYEPEEKIKKLSVKIYDASGNFVRKLSENEFQDRNAASGSTFHTDSRVIIARVRQNTYPFTVVISYNFETPNTAFIPYFMPVHSYNQSLETSNYTITWPESINGKSAEFNLEKASKQEIGNSVIYSLDNFASLNHERQCPLYTTQFPHARWALEDFNLEGQTVKAKTWDDLGKWMYSSLLKEGLELPDSTTSHIRSLVENMPDKRDRAKTVYEYMQNNTRYISIQLGIGGWKPMPAKEVNTLGYGDCKALVNYTQALLTAADVPSQYVVVYAGSEKQDLLESVPSIQGNHVILRIPDEEKPIWLECTSQTMPFGHLGTFTDDRLVLVIDENGGELLKTPASSEKENRKILKADYTLDEMGNLSLKGSIEAKGTYYQEYQRVERYSNREKRKFYESQFEVTLLELELKNNSYEAIDNLNCYKHSFELTSKNYAKAVGAKESLFIANPILDPVDLPENDHVRENDIYVQRSSSSLTEVTFTFSDGQSLGHIPESKTIDSEFGTYKLEVYTKDEKTLMLKRSLSIFNGTYSKTKYNAYRQFFKDIAEADGSKILLNQ